MNIYVYILTMALVTYLIRVLPLVLFRKKIQNRFVSSFYIMFHIPALQPLPYLPYSTVLKV